MTYIVTARKWRPVVFDDIVGQSHIATTLRNAITSDRLSHAYIFSGPRGVGKTTTARILAKTVNCLHPHENNPDNACDLCVEINEGRSVNVFEIDGASNRGVEEIRNLRESVRYGPAKGKYKIYIIDEVHMLTKEAFNALLKTLEEPPSYVIFIFATTEIHKVPLTILSRCQRFDFRRIAIEEITERLRFIAREEKITIDDEALFLIARRGDGSMRDAQSIFDQVVSYCGERVDAKQLLTMLNIVDEETHFRITDLIKAKDVRGGLLLVDEVMNRGYDVREFLNGLMEHLRNILVARSTNNTTLIESSEHYRKRYGEIAERFAESDLLRLIKIASDTEAAIRWSQQPRLKLEIGLVQMIKLDSSVEISTLLKQIESLQKGGNRTSLEETTSLPNAQLSQSTSAPVRGNVKATPPTLRADQVVTSPVPVAEPAPVYLHQAAPMNVTTDDILNKWSVIVDEARKKRIALGSMLSATSPVGIQNGTLKICCPDDFHRDAIVMKRNQQFLQDLAEQVYGARFQLEAIISHSVPAAEQKPQPAEKQDTFQQQDGNHHPVIDALIREFGAKPITR